MKVHKTVDLRSDTVTRPTAAMREAMMSAELGDDVFGDDPSVNALQAKIASMLGFEAALFCPTGTQSNLCGILSHCQRGDEYIVGQQAHTYRFEGGGAAVLGSVQPQPLSQNAAGLMDLKEIANAIKPDDPHFAKTQLLCLENTWNGHPMTMEYLQAATELARSRGLATHLDGARVFNAARAGASDLAQTLLALKRISANFDSVSVCFSKGLGAPVGSALCGSKALIAKAKRIRKMTGGGMRQSGLLAAAASYALDHHIDRLAEDHTNAAALATALGQIPELEISQATNIVFAKLVGKRAGEGAQLLAHMQSHGVLATGLIGLRLVTHLDVNDSDIDYAVQVIKGYFYD